jgi:glycerate dehydrogenase
MSSVQLESRRTIVALDSHPIDFDGLSWSPIEKLGSFSKYPRTLPEQLSERGGNADVLVVNKFKLTADALQVLPALRLVCITATGTNNVDLECCKQRGVAVTNVKDYSAEAVSQLVISYLLKLATRVSDYEKLVRDGSWFEAADFCIGLPGHYELAGKTIGIVGLGAIGSAVARIASAFSMRVIAAKLPGRSYSAVPGVERVDLDQLFARADFITLHVPLTEETHQMINSKSLSLMKPSAVLINTGRGDLVDEIALSQALKSGRLAHACLDVVSVEPPRRDNPLFDAPNITFTPHIAWATKEARTRLMAESAENIRAFLAGERRNRVA